MEPKLILVNARLVFLLIVALGGALITAKVDPANLYPILRRYLVGMVIIGIGLDIFGRLKLSGV